ncbi:hypothetical protein [Croceivirga thetidis]|uniref:DUF4377 domain-containing protein n=1 Tax=Croceivirga thetidis TaxID=2721623 RepID=A0ABX1GSE7_9FLAO|nr:hypothetical protein [Croceivirga thetidis]NKI32524.1 hypothetical protein [Croceivirga thetidis]
MGYQKFFASLSLVILAFFFNGCDEISECVFGVNPEIHDRRLSMGVVGEQYYDVITAEVKNAVFDNSYDYFFDVLGELPPGVYFDIDRRSIELYGTPQEAGTYYFSVELFVETFDEDGFDGSPTCKEYVERQFSIRVLP